MDYLKEYKEIAPYEGQEFIDAIERLIDYDKLKKNLASVIFSGSLISTYKLSWHFRRNLPDDLAKITNYTDFQKIFTCNYVLNTIEENSINKFTFSGIEKILEKKAYLFISNHRDIVLDCALLDYALEKSGKGLCEMCFGDNLLVNQLATDLLKCNGGITVKRKMPAKELMQSSKILSSYIEYCITEKIRSVWIAQKSGRSKDGIDNTSTAILKMIYLNSRKNKVPFNEMVKKMNIVPVSISYQYDPCDISKGREQIHKLKHAGAYKKAKYEDVLHMLKGLRQNKGNVHIAFGDILRDDYESPVDCAREMDRQIHLNYKLWNTNYFAYDYVNGTKTFQKEYQDLNVDEFLGRYSNTKEEIKDYVLNTYANPVVSKLKEEGLSN